VIHIYGLVERGKDVTHIGYIGLTENPKKRLSSHRISIEDTPKGKWIASLRASGKTVEMILLDSAETREDAHTKENAWIIFAKSRCWPVTNGTEPGTHRALLDSEIRSIEDVVAAMNQIRAETEIATGALRDEIAKTKNEFEYSIERMDNHFSRLYKIATGVALGIPAVILSYVAFGIFSFEKIAEKGGIFEAVSFTVMSIVAYPILAFTVWLFLKDVPFYRPGVGSERWTTALSDHQSSALGALKRIGWHIVLTAVVVGSMILFEGQ